MFVVLGSQQVMELVLLVVRVCAHCWRADAIVVCNNEVIRGTRNPLETLTQTSRSLAERKLQFSLSVSVAYHPRQLLLEPPQDTRNVLTMAKRKISISSLIYTRLVGFLILARKSPSNEEETFIEW